MAKLWNKSPGVYVKEQDAFPNSVVPAATAMPAFVGYTEKASSNGTSLKGAPQKISSFAEYVIIFGGPYKSKFEILAGTESENLVSFDGGAGGGTYYKLKETSAHKFYMYASIKLFFENGGFECYVVSVADYAPVTKADLLAGLDTLTNLVSVSLLVVPEVTLLPSVAEYGEVVQAMLAQCGQLGDRFSILDVYGTLDLDSSLATFEHTDLPATIAEFRTAVGIENLSYGAAYFPFLKTSVYSSSEVDFTYFENASLIAMLKAQASTTYGDTRLKEAEALIDNTANAAQMTPKQIEVLDIKLTESFPVLKQAKLQVTMVMGTVPPSGGIAGVYAQVDSNSGVWTVPANVAMLSVTEPTLAIDDGMKQDLYAPLDGKAIDVIRSFPGKGTLVWGARTLLGNSEEWRYVTQRRMEIYVRQTIKVALQTFAFAPNDQHTWSTVTNMVSNFLNNTFAQGGLAGSTPDTAFSVRCGLDSTMSRDDIKRGYMKVEMDVALVRPAEFTTLKITQMVRPI